jgi:hypothetical protein
VCADAKLRLGGAGKAQFRQQRRERRVRHKTILNHHRLMAAGAPKRGLTASVQHHSERGSITRGGNASTGAYGYVADARGARQRVRDDGGLERVLVCRIDVLPIAPAAASGDGGARGCDAFWSGFQHALEISQQVVARALRDARDHGLTGQGALDEYRSPVGRGGKRRPAGYEFSRLKRE